VYLVKKPVPPEAIGFALTIATLSSLCSQVPAEAALDSMRDKRRAVLLGTAGVGLAALLLCMMAARPAVYLALAAQGLASSLIGRSLLRLRSRAEGEVPPEPDMDDLTPLQDLSHPCQITGDGHSHVQRRSKPGSAQAPLLAVFCGFEGSSEP
jgi:hypothetical protein